MQKDRPLRNDVPADQRVRAIARYHPQAQSRPVPIGFQRVARWPIPIERPTRLEVLLQFLLVDKFLNELWSNADSEVEPESSHRTLDVLALENLHGQVFRRSDAGLLRLEDDGIRDCGHRRARVQTAVEIEWLSLPVISGVYGSHEQKRCGGARLGRRKVRLPFQGVVSPAGMTS